MKHFPFGLTQLQGSWHIFHFFSQAQIDGTFSVCFDPVTGLKAYRISVCFESVRRMRAHFPFVLSQLQG
jgi:hypothetical protein